MAPNSPACSFIHASMAGSRSTAPSNRSNSVLIISLLSARLPPALAAILSPLPLPTSRQSPLPRSRALSRFLRPVTFTRKPGILVFGGTAILGCALFLLYRRVYLAFVFVASVVAGLSDPFLFFAYDTDFQSFALHSPSVF